MLTRKTLKKGLIFGVIILMLLACRLPFDLLGRGDTPETTEVIEEIGIVISTEDEVIPTEDMAPTITETPDPLSLLPDYVQEALGWEVLFEDDFSGESKGWWTGVSDGEDWVYSSEIINGQLLWTYEDIDRNFPLGLTTGSRVRYLGDVYATLQVQLIDGYEDAAYGLSFRAERSGYMFTIRSGSYRLMTFDYNEWVTSPVIDWTPSDAIIPGGMNELSVIASGEQIALLINGELVADITDDTYTLGEVGLAFDMGMANERMTIAIDGFQLRARAINVYQDILEWPLAFNETFESNQHDWPIGEVSKYAFDAEFNLADGRYQIEIDITGEGSHIEWVSPGAIGDLDDFYLVVDIDTTNYVEDSDYVLVFRDQPKGYYGISIRFSQNRRGFFVILNYEDEYSIPASGDLPADVQVGDTIRLGVAANEDHIILLLNELIVGEFYDDMLGSGKLGIGGAGEGVFTYQSFSIYSPDGNEEMDVSEIEAPIETDIDDSRPDLESSVNPLDGAGMVFVPAGEFLMGYTGSEAEEDEGPERQVYLDAYWLYETPVTNSQYRQCIQDGSCTGTLSRFPEDQHPVTRIDWSQADAYCDYAGGRLPTEAEWEKGARGTDGRLFPWGDGSPNCNLANYQGCYGNQTTIVGRFPDGASPYGALDMLGLVWEWVSDWYDEDYYTYSPTQNPTGPVEGGWRVMRGHSFESRLNYLRLTDRGRSDPTKGDYRKGFRCVLPDLP